MEICVLSAQPSPSLQGAKHPSHVVPLLLASLLEHAYSQTDHHPTIRLGCCQYMQSSPHGKSARLSILPLAAAPLCVTSSGTPAQTHMEMLLRECESFSLQLCFRLARRQYCRDC